MGADRPPRHSTSTQSNSRSMRRPNTGSLLLRSHPPPLAAIPPPTDCAAAVVEEIPGLIRLHKNGHVERLPAMPEVPHTYSPDPTATAVDVTINPSAGLWARIHVPDVLQADELPVVLYFHGGGFCVGSPAWCCYHSFLARLAASAACVVVSPNYRLAPEHRLPAAYDDGAASLAWLLSQSGRVGPDEAGWSWRARCDFARIFIAGDSAGAAIAYSAVALHEKPPASVRGVILVQPFFGGEERTASERESSKSALSLSAADSYWRLALPAGCDRDSIWCNPIGAEGLKRMERAGMPGALVCVAEMDILRDRNMEFCGALKGAGKKLEVEMYEGVGHAFHLLHGYYTLSRNRTNDLISDVTKFITNI